MKLTLLCSNAAGFRGAQTMNFREYWNLHLALHPADNKGNLEELVSLVKRENADIVGLNEIDKCTHWGGRVDQLEYLKKRLGYDGYYGRNYNSPAPWLYTADTGNAVLSRFPVDKFATGTHSFEHSNFYETITAMFGAKKFIHSVILLPKGKRLHVVCTHLSTNFRELREVNALDLVWYFKENILPLHEACGDSYVLMGDLNTVPLYTQKRFGFVDDERDSAGKTNSLADRIMDSITNKVEEFFPDDYRKDYTLHILKHSRLFKSTMKLDPFNPDEVDDGRYHTYPQKPNRMIDYIFVSPDIETTDVETIPVGCSDHRVIKTVVFVPD